MLKYTKRLKYLSRKGFCYEKGLFIFALAAVISLSAVSLVGCGKNEVNHANAAVSASATPSEAKRRKKALSTQRLLHRRRPQRLLPPIPKQETRALITNRQSKEPKRQRLPITLQKRRTILRQAAPRRLRAAIKALRAAVRPIVRPTAKLTIRAARARIKTQAITPIPTPTTARPQRVRRLTHTPVKLGTKRYIKPSITRLLPEREKLSTNRLILMKNRFMKREKFINARTAE